jgi:hypothetical protein
MAGHPEGTIGWHSPVSEPLNCQSGSGHRAAVTWPMPLPPRRLTAQGAELGALVGLRPPSRRPHPR